jgi:hypothetical protein
VHSDFPNAMYITSKYFAPLLVCVKIMQAEYSAVATDIHIESVGSQIMGVCTHILHSKDIKTDGRRAKQINIIVKQ